jgi:hypothetical protein
MGQLVPLRNGAAWATDYVAKETANIHRMFETMATLAPDGVMARLIDGVLTPRMHRRLVVAAEILGGAV